MSKRDASLLLEDMLEAAEKIERFTNGWTTRHLLKMTKQ
jgi:uncharacterized protein with HEPN domain